MQDHHGRFPGQRGQPLTSIVLRLPTDSENILLPNDREALGANGYLLAEGVRNTASMAFGPGGKLFGVENSGDRDDSDELNWLRQGNHYGFPWRMGTNDNPQQFPGFIPENDPLIDKRFAAYQKGFFHDDPGFPPPPPGVAFTDPIPSMGPDADKYRDVAAGKILDASDEGTTIGTFTAHRAPFGLVFDNERARGGRFTGDGFCVSRATGDPDGESIAGPFHDAGEDLLHLELIGDPEHYRVRVTRMAAGFSHPRDAVLIGNKLYVLESEGRIWEVTLPEYDRQTAWLYGVYEWLRDLVS